MEGLDLATALELLKWPVELGDAPSGQAVLLARGKYGFYVQQGELRASIQKVCLLSVQNHVHYNIQHHAVQHQAAQDNVQQSTVHSMQGLQDCVNCSSQNLCYSTRGKHTAMSL